MKIKSLLIAISSTLALSTVAVAHNHGGQEEQAQDRYQGQQQMQQQHNQVQVDSLTVENFVEAMYDVNSISEEYTTRMEAVDTPEEAQVLQAEAQERMLVALDENDITPEEYQGVQEVAQNVPELMDRIMSLYEERISRG